MNRKGFLRTTPSASFEEPGGGSLPGLGPVEPNLLGGHQRRVVEGGVRQEALEGKPLVPEVLERPVHELVPAPAVMQLDDLPGAEPGAQAGVPKLSVDLAAERQVAVIGVTPSAQPGRCSLSNHQLAQVGEEPEIFWKPRV